MTHQVCPRCMYPWRKKDSERYYTCQKKACHAVLYIDGEVMIENNPLEKNTVRMNDR